MTREPLFNVLVIGAGAIGASYDTPGSSRVLSHAHGFSAHPGFHLLGFVDSDPRRGERAARLWGGRHFATVEEAFEKERVDVACVAVPDHLHYPLLKKISAFPLKGVFTEKPLTTALPQGREIVDLFRERGVPVCVNYRRSFVPEFEELRNRVKRGDFGRYLVGTGYYGKGLLHNGSHLVHLLRSLLGEVRGEEVVASEGDFSEDDPSVSATLFFDGGVFNLSHVNCGLYTVFELDLFFEKGRSRITDTGFTIEYHTVRKLEIFEGYDFLAKSDQVTTQLDRSLLHAAGNLYSHLTGKEPLKCSAQDALDTMVVCERMRSGAGSVSQSPEQGTRMRREQRRRSLQADDYQREEGYP